MTFLPSELCLEIEFYALVKWEVKRVEEWCAEGRDVVTAKKPFQTLICVNACHRPNIVTVLSNNSLILQSVREWRESGLPEFASLS